MNTNNNLYYYALRLAKRRHHTHTRPLNPLTVIFFYVINLLCSAPAVYAHTHIYYVIRSNR